MSWTLFQFIKKHLRVKCNEIDSRIDRRNSMSVEKQEIFSDSNKRSGSFRYRKAKEF